ncbi:acyltransferase family protein [Paraburkholderia caledonica]|uniref:Peptidoglycan/LPS O-acetylase OafA/YrhL n=1 Tax=Paraburkholderia caledonica TaxID=134536 RepID=A0ABU1L289_9BURK|nr:acyltransferase [Paraburkholderia caledonica]MDR6377328.1 peptidoglycan/LPS O-acetylase OafA/YrhL [Paraburkholderia caledonica]
MADALKRENNNADLLRLIAACAVIWGHAYGLTGSSVQEPVSRLLGFDYSGSLAVKFFFFVSGLLVTNSWISNPSAVRFVCARAFRILPALVMSAAICLLILGPLLTELPRRVYFSNTWIYWHIFTKPAMGYLLPGALLHNPNPVANGVLWTIPYELAMYGLLLCAGVCGLLRLKWLASATLVAIIVLFIARPETVTALGFIYTYDAGLLPAFFAAGALFALHKDRVVINGAVVAGLVLTAFVLKGSPAFRYCFYAAFLMTALWIMTLRLVRQIHLGGDYSYGVYLFGWPVQQTIIAVFPKLGLAANQALSIVIALAIAAVSWHIVERRFIRIGHRVPDRIGALSVTRPNTPCT